MCIHRNFIFRNIISIANLKLLKWENWTSVSCPQYIPIFTSRQCPSGSVFLWSLPKGTSCPQEFRKESVLPPYAHHFQQYNVQTCPWSLEICLSSQDFANVNKIKKLLPNSFLKQLTKFENKHFLFGLCVKTL